MSRDESLLGRHTLQVKLVDSVGDFQVIRNKEVKMTGCMMDGREILV